ncbi:Protein fam72a [Podila horticola]|nr:Protein fam72a [Podila horticola]
MDQMQISQPQTYSQSPTSYLTPHELRQPRTPQRTRPRRQSLVASDSQLGGPLPLNSSMPSVNNATASHHRYSQQHPVQRHYRSSGPTSAPPTVSPYSASNTYLASYAPHPEQPSQLRNIAPRPAPHRSQQQQQYLRQFQQQQHHQRTQGQAQGQTQGQAQGQTQGQAPSPNNISPSLHPQFRAKAVCRLTCRSCLSDVCMRGMKAILLADSRIELYSTDRPPAGVQLVYDDYRTRNCKCRIRDVACLGCGNTLGYHVTQPCESCLEACNNGHFWMFHSDGVSCTERFLPRTASAVRAARAARAALASSSLPSSSSSTSEEGRVGRRRSTRGGVAAVVEQEAQDLSWRRRTSIHDIEYNHAVGNNPVAGRSGSLGGNGNEEGDNDEEEGEIEEEEEDDEVDEEEPVVMLWAALHAQEERYLQQMQQLQLQMQQQRRMQHEQLQQEEEEEEEEEEERRVAPVVTVAVANGTPSLNVGGTYYSLISTAISNASMMLWDEGRTLNQYEQLCR